MSGPYFSLPEDEPEKRYLQGMELIEESGLPLPWVNYEGVYRSWLSFQEAADGQPFLCSCFLPAMQGFLTSERIGQYRLAEGDTNLLRYFLSGAARSRNRLTAETVEEIAECGILRREICHLCSEHVPSVMTGGPTILEAHFGVYVQMAEWELQVFSEFDRKRWKVIRPLEPRSYVAARLGFLGQDNVSSEDMLFLCVRGAFPGAVIKRRYQRRQLEGMHVDLYLPEQRLAVEYQGEQHFKPVKPFGGEAGFIKTQARDKRKRELCHDLGIHLVEFDDKAVLTENWVRHQLLRYWYSPEVELPAGVPVPWVKLRPSGPDWERLDGEQRLNVLIQLWLLEAVEARLRRPKAKRLAVCAEVSAICFSRWGVKGSRRGGFSTKAIYVKYLTWERMGANRRWQDTLRYESLVKDKGEALRQVGLTIEIAKGFFRSVPGGASGWSKRHGISAGDMRACLSENRIGGEAERIARLLRKEIDERVVSLLALRTEREEAIRRLRQEVKRITDQLADIGRPLD